MLSGISHTEKDTTCFHSYVDPEKFNRSPVRRRRGGKKLQRGKEANHKRLLNTENKLRVDGDGVERKVGDGH